MIRIFGLLLCSLMLLGGEVRAQDSTGFAFSRRPLRDGADYASCIRKNIRKNDRKCLWATNLEILVSVKDRHPSVKTVEELARYVESLVNVPCPQNKVVVLYRLLVFGKERSTESGGWRRQFRQDEVCLADNNTGLVEFSLWCGNPIGEELEIELPKPKKNEVVELPLPQARVKDTIYLVGYGSVDVTVAGEKVNVREDRIVSFSNVVLSVHIVKDTITRATQALKVDTVTVVRNRTNWKTVVASSLIAGVGGFFLGANQDVTVNNSCGGPVNPPNSRMRLGEGIDQKDILKAVRLGFKIPF